jgi:hypothetical protein
MYLFTNSTLPHYQFSVNVSTHLPKANREAMQGTRHALLNQTKPPQPKNKPPDFRELPR